MKHHILNAIGPALDPEARALLRSLGTVEDVAESSAAVLQRAADCTVLFLGLRPRIDAAFLDAAPNLRCIALPVTGLDHIDLDAAEARGIRVISLRDDRAFLTNVTGTAELAFGLLIALLRKIPAAHASVCRGTWDRQPFLGQALAGKTLGIVGVGRLGAMVARYAQAFGMTVLGCDPSPDSALRGVRWLPLHDLLAQSDAVTLHARLDASTQGMIDAAALAAMKPGAVLVNTARGALIDDAALLAALQSGHLGGFAADVLTDEERLATDGTQQHPLVVYARTHDTVLLTPHIGGMTADGRSLTDRHIAQQVCDYCRTL